MSGLLAFFKKSMGLAAKPNARSAAKERLSLMLVTQRSSAFLDGLDMEAFQGEVAQVVQKYMKIAAEKKPQIAVKPDGELDVLEIHFPLDYVRGKNSSGQSSG